jgi:hypothetical protein
VCAQHCIPAVDEEMIRCIQRCLDCAPLCHTCLTLLARDSQYVGQLCRLCADACDACAAECERFDDDLMRQCADACRRAAETCRAMAASREGDARSMRRVRVRR